MQLSYDLYNLVNSFINLNPTTTTKKHKHKHTHVFIYTLEICVREKRKEKKQKIHISRFDLVRFLNNNNYDCKTMNAEIKYERTTFPRRIILSLIQLIFFASHFHFRIFLCFSSSGNKNCYISWDRETKQKIIKAHTKLTKTFLK